MIQHITVNQSWTPPQWAVRERDLLKTLNQAAQEFVARYTRADGTLLWNREDWPGMDGSDDPYEGFMNLALLYALGGDDQLYADARRIWEGITWQWTEYGQLNREFDRYYDWMHHGEGYLFLYFLGLCSGDELKDRQRAVRFAGFYDGSDPIAQNYDTEHQLIRSPLTGSDGPRFEVNEEDWSTHRGILDGYLAPYEDIAGNDFQSLRCAWSDDAVYADIIAKMNARMNRGDVPLNLNATGLMTHAFLHTGRLSYKDWVINYLAAWRQRAADNGGIIPDNIGLDGQIGTYNDGKWWGGYYGWRWPHGFLTIIEPLTNAVMNAVLLTGDYNQLALAREQLDVNWSLGREVDGAFKIPYKHFDAGWTDYRLPNPIYPIYLWSVSMADEDLQRVLRIEPDHDWNQVIVPRVSGRDPETGRETKHYIGNTIPWFRFIQGEYPQYPDDILSANAKLIDQQLTRMRAESGDPRGWGNSFNDDDFSSIHIWQEKCPVYFEGLLQLMWGGPMHISHGGLQHARVRYYDAERKRPGLPEDVAALVDQLTDRTASVQLVNLNRFASRTVIVQGGTFGEHRFDTVEWFNQEGESLGQQVLTDKWLSVELAPGAGVRLALGMTRYAYAPTYDQPWSDEAAFRHLLTGRTEAQ